MTCASFSSSSATTEMTFAGLSAFSIRNAGLSSQLMISIFSPRSSFTIALTLAPFKPTHAPTGSTFGSVELTAIFVLEPASRAIARISTVPSRTSAISASNRRLTRSG